MTPQQLHQLAIIKSAKKTNRPNPSKTIKAMEPAKEVYLERWEGSESVKYWYWLVDAKTEEPIDGSSKRYVALDMANRWGLKIIRKK